MSVTHFRLVIALLLLTLLASGCTWSRRSSVAPSQEGSVSAITADMEALKAENTALRKKQEDSAARIADLQKTIAAGQEETRRFREQMNTNFDLLEQSVALTLANSINKGMMEDPPAKSVERTPARKKNRSMASAALKTGNSGHPLSEPPPVKSTVKSTVKQPVSLAVSKRNSRSAVRGGVVKAKVVNPRRIPPFDDPDLSPPANPRKLFAHPAARALYEKGFALFAKREYDQSILLFRNFLIRFPNDLYSDNAQFWIGESHLRMNQRQDAEKAYRTILRTYAHRSTLEGYKTPDAIYRLGQSRLRIKDYQQARYYFQSLVDRFPETSSGRKAYSELNNIGVKTAAN